MSLRVRDLRVTYEKSILLDSLDLSVGPAEIVAVLGPSGIGKSTLLRAIAGLEPYTGSISWDGADLRSVPAHKRGFALMFQDGQLFGHLTVARNVAYAFVRTASPLWRRGVGTGARRENTQALEACATVRYLPDCSFGVAR